MAHAGFGCHRSIEQDDLYLEQLKEFFKIDAFRVYSLNSVCFTVVSSDVRLGPEQKHVYNKVWSSILSA